MILKTKAGHLCFDYIGKGANKLIDWTMQGSVFVFGDLARSDKLGFIFACQVLPTIIFVSSLSAVLYHLRILQAVLKLMARLMTHSKKSPTAISVGRPHSVAKLPKAVSSRSVNVTGSTLWFCT